MKTLSFRDTYYNIGVVLVLICFLLYLLTGSNTTDDALVGIFFFHFIISSGYWFFLGIIAIFKRRSAKFNRVFPALTLSLISAYSLNRWINVFDTSPLWFMVVLVLVSVACLCLPFYQDISRKWRMLLMTSIGIGLMVFLYLSIYLIPVYPISVMVCFALGISLHTFVPLFFILFISIWLFRFGKLDPKALWGVLAGSGFVLILVIVFSVRWVGTVNQINDSYRDTFLENEATLPAWVRVAQRIPRNDISNKVLKLDLKYVVPDLFSDDWFGLDFPSRSSFDEPREHNPFVVIASLFCEKPSISNDEKIKILESIYDCRHHAVERLWSDDGIETSFINSSIQIWPQYRMAYTEQLFMIRNTRESWRGGEAVYTFHLPEGSAVSSLSLWVNGREEKGILTTKEKADSAYRTIVGVEARDPSLVHWKEGSTVNVRVFPVTKEEERVFKIGITSPLRKEKERLVYQPVYFEGTDYTKAKASHDVTFMQAPLNPVYPSFFSGNDNDLELTSKNKRKYKSDWAICMDNPGLSDKPFYFDGYSYTVTELQTQQIPVDIRDIYLDINHSWTKSEYETILQLAGNRNVWVYDGYNIREAKAKEGKLLGLQFSLFPIHCIKHPLNSLIISKSTPVSPNLDDLKSSGFISDFSTAVSPEMAPYFFNLGNELSSYLKTLREFRLLNYAQGDVEALEKVLQNSFFTQATPEDGNFVAVHDAQLNIRREKTISKAEAPDHLMRLFAYNYIMSEYANSWHSPALTDSLVSEAQQAYIVSPVSSLVVLETQADYDRFDIKDREDSLHNASVKSKGSVPEPHEWALLAIIGGIAVFLYMKRKRTTI